MQTRKGYFLALSTAIISGFAVFINRFGVKMTNPYVYTWLKNLVVVFMLCGALLVFKDWRILRGLHKKQWFLLLTIGLVGGSIPFLLFFKGLSLTTAANGAFLHKTMFIFVAVLAGLFLKEKIDKKFLLGAVLLLLGNFLFVKKLSPAVNTGDLLILLAALFWAVENIISKYALRELPGIIVAWGRMFFGAIFIFIFLLFSGQASLLPGLSLIHLGWALLTGIILFGYVITWYSGLRYMPVSQATVILLLGSPITTLLTFLWTGQITLQAVVAGFLVLFGVVLALGIGRVWNSLKKFKTAYVRA